MVVQFNPTSQVHILCVWTYAYKAARRSLWEQAARDRERFQLRIERMKKLITPVLIKKYNLYVDNKIEEL